MRALEQLNQKLGIDNFELHLRLSTTRDGSKAPRWTEEFIKKEMKQLKG